MRYFFALGRLQTRPLPVATEGDLATAAAVRFGRVLATAKPPAGLAQTFGRKKRKTLTVVTRSEAAQVLAAVTGGGGNFVGDPGDGNFNIGIALGPNGNGTVSAARTHYGTAWPGDSKVSVIHNYSTNDNGVNASMLDEAINAGFIPSQSFKMQNFTRAQILGGSADAAIDTSAAVCDARAPWPIWLTYWHEPEDDFAAGTAANDYRAAFRYIVMRFRAAGVANVAFQPIYQNPYTFTPSNVGGSGRDYRNWHPDWNGSGWYSDLTMDMFGADTYDPLPGSTNNKTFEQMWARLKTAVEVPGAPVWDYTQPEFGMSYHATPRPNWNTWCIDARDFALANRIKNFTYWDNSSDIGRYSFTATGDPDGTKLTGWKNVLVAQAVKKVTA